MEEEVWNDINLSSLNELSTTASDQTFRDFFSRPSFSNTKHDPQTTKDSSSFGHSITLYPPPPPPKRKSTPLIKNSEPNPGFRFLETRAPVFNFAMGSPVLNKKRAPQENGHDTGDRKNQRLMKNRESAARSRARKQAYTDELEVEVANLKKENAKLKKQLTQFYLEKSPAQIPKKRNLHRTLTAPF